MSRVKVTINKKGYIPGLGQGPIRRPILIEEDLYKQLLALGYPVTVMIPSVVPVVKKEEQILPKIEKTETPITSVVEQVVEEPAETHVTIDEDKVEESVEETEEEVTTEPAEEVIEILENDPDLSAEAYYTEDFLTSKALCKKILSAREVQYEKDASFGLLKELVLGSNPEIDE